MGDAGCEIGLEGGDSAIVGGWRWWWWLAVKNQISRSAATLARSARLMRGRHQLSCLTTRQPGPTRANPCHFPEKDRAGSAVSQWPSTRVRYSTAHGTTYTWTTTQAMITCTDKRAVASLNGGSDDLDRAPKGRGSPGVVSSDRCFKSN